MKTYLRVGILVLLTLFLTGCGQVQKPEETVMNAIEAFSQRDVAAVSGYFSYNDLFGKLRSEIAYEDEIGELLLANLECDVLSTKQKRKKAVVTAEITNIDLDAIYNEYVEESMNLSLAAAFSDKELPSEEAMIEYFITLLNREDNVTHTTLVEINLEKAGNQWLVLMDEELEKAISGGKIYTFAEVGLAFRD